MLIRRRQVLATLGAAISVAGVPAWAVAAGKAAQIRAELGPSGSSGWMLIDMDTGQVLDSHNPVQAFVPASVAKLPTAAFALDALGHDHRFETQVIGTGTLQGGQLTGDLVLTGGGDPELDNDALPTLLDGLVRRGVRSVQGGFFVDGTALPQLRQIEPTQGTYASYNPSISGLNLNFNRVHLKWGRPWRKAPVIRRSRGYPGHHPN